MALRADPVVLRLAEKRDGNALQLAAEALQDAVGTVGLAVKEDGSALQFAAEALQDDAETVRSASASRGSDGIVSGHARPKGWAPRGG